MRTILGLCGMLAVALPAGAAPEDAPSWTGTVSLQIRFDQTDRSNSGGGELSCSGVESVRRSYDATATLHGGAEGVAEISGEGAMETFQTCSGRQRCPGETLGAIGPERAYSRVTRNVVRTSASGRGMATVNVELDDDGRYTVGVEFPPIAGGSSITEATDRTSGGCFQVEPQDSRFTDSNWTLDGESASASGQVDASHPDSLVGEAAIDEWTTLRWDLRRAPPDCEGLARQLGRERERQRQDQERDEALSRQLRDALGLADAALAGAEAAGQLPPGIGTVARMSAAKAIASLPVPGGGDSFTTDFDDWASGGDALDAQMQLQATQALAPSAAVAQLLDLFQQSTRQASLSQAGQSLIDALEEALRQCRQ